MVKKIQTIIAFIVSMAILCYEVCSIVPLFSSGRDCYIFPRAYTRSAVVVLGFIILSVLLLGVIVAIFFIIRNFRFFSVTAVVLRVLALVLCVIFILYASFFAALAVPVRFQSYTDDTENYMVLDYNAEFIFNLVVEENIFDFDQATIKEYEYTYEAFPFTYDRINIDATVEFSEEEYNSYLELIKTTSDMATDSSYTDAEGGVRYIIYNFEFDYTEECTITFYKESREVKISVFIEYDT